LIDKSAIISSEEELHVQDPHNWSSTLISFIDCARQQPASSLITVCDEILLSLYSANLMFGMSSSITDASHWRCMASEVWPTTQLGVLGSILRLRMASQKYEIKKFRSWINVKYPSVNGHATQLSKLSNI